ncbi:MULTISPECIES: TetR/AcrR family transcriptional regulator [unclassified Streptomyces]|uniref:TetR/AcrR family transcriptional regulator n=1 Tax=unclassified Streptomyces TaxID=2593676 RepID=UPI003D8F88EE
MGRPSTNAAAGSRGPGRPRDRAIDDIILEEARREVAENGIASFNFHAVARRAGVARNTMYLRWAKREDLIKAALLAGHNPTAPELAGVLAEDLATLADIFAASFAADGALSAYYQLSVTSLTDPEMWDWARENIIAPAHAIPERVIREAQERGDARPDVDAGVVARMMVGGIFAEAILRVPHGHVSEEFRRMLVANVLALVEPEPA